MGLSRTAMAGGRADLLAAAALMAGVTAVALAGWRAVVLWREAGPQPAPAVSAGAPSAASPAAALDARAAGLFGRAPARASAPSPAALPETRARLRLYGIVVPPRGEPLALVGGPGRPTRLVRAGDRLGGRVRIEAIGPDGVVLLRDGRRERLALPRASLATAARAPAGGAAVRLVPWRSGGRLAGLRVAALPAEVAARTGLRPGDVITEVDGMPLVAPEEARLVAAALRLPRPPRLEVLRGGARLELGAGASGRQGGG